MIEIDREDPIRYDQETGILTIHLEVNLRGQAAKLADEIDIPLAPERLERSLLRIVADMAGGLIGGINERIERLFDDDTPDEEAPGREGAG